MPVLSPVPNRNDDIVVNVNLKAKSPIKKIQSLPVRSSSNDGLPSRPEKTASDPLLADELNEQVKNKYVKGEPRLEENF